MIQPFPTKSWTNGSGNSALSESQLVEKFSRMFHTFPIEFQQSYRLQLEYPLPLDEYLPSGETKEKRPDFLIYTPSNVFLVECKATLLTIAMIREVIVERRYLQRFKQENVVPDHLDLRMLFLAPQIQPDCHDLIKIVNAALGTNQYGAMTLCKFSEKTLSWFNSWCEAEPSVTEFQQNSINRRIKSDCAPLFLFG